MFLAGSSTTTSFTDASISVEGTYQYFVVAVDKAGNAGPPTAVKTITYDVTPPTVPTGLQASASPTNAKPALAFDVATDTGGTGVVSYRLYRNGTSVATAAGTTVVDTALATDGTATYTVTALDAAGNESAASTGVSVVYDKTAPPVPTGVNAAATPTNAKPALTWTSGGADALSGFARYDVYRGATLAGSSTSTSFTDAALSTSGSYSYTVKTIDNAGNVSNASTAKVVVYDVIAPPVPGGFDGAGRDEGEADADVHRRRRHRRVGHRPLQRVPGRSPARCRADDLVHRDVADVPGRLLRVHRERRRQGRERGSADGAEGGRLRHRGAGRPGHADHVGAGHEGEAGDLVDRHDRPGRVGRQLVRGVPGRRPDRGRRGRHQLPGHRAVRERHVRLRDSRQRRGRQRVRPDGDRLDHLRHRRPTGARRSDRPDADRRESGR